MEQYDCTFFFFKSNQISIHVLIWPCQHPGKRVIQLVWVGGWKPAGLIWMFALWINSSWPIWAMMEEFFILFALIYPLVSLCLLFFNETIFKACCFWCREYRRTNLSIFILFRKIDGCQNHPLAIWWVMSLFFCCCDCWYICSFILAGAI